MSTISVRYVGADRVGVARTGRNEVTDLLAWVEHKYRCGWRELRVYAVDDVVNTIGGIGRHGDTGKRSWWARVGA